MPSVPRIAEMVEVSSSRDVQQLRDTILPSLFCNAAKMNNSKWLKILKESGVHVSNPDYNLRTALHVAASNGNLEAVNFLLSHGVNINQQ